MVRATLGDSLMALRLVPALAHAGTVWTAGLLAAELGGRRFAQGLLNKLSFLFLGAGLAVGLTLARRDVLKDRYIYMGAAVAGAIALPHLVWQVAHGWPTRWRCCCGCRGWRGCSAARRVRIARSAGRIWRSLR